MRMPLKRLQQLDTLLTQAVNEALHLRAGTVEQAQGNAEEIYTTRLAIRLGILERALLRAGISAAKEGEALPLDEHIRELEGRFSVAHVPTLWREKQESVVGKQEN